MSMQGPGFLPIRLRARQSELLLTEDSLEVDWNLPGIPTWHIDRSAVVQVDWRNRHQMVFRSLPGDHEWTAPGRAVGMIGARPFRRTLVEGTWIWFDPPQAIPEDGFRWVLLRRLSLFGGTALTWPLHRRPPALHAVMAQVDDDPIAAKRAWEVWGFRFPPGGAPS